MKKKIKEKAILKCRKLIQDWRQAIEMLRKIEEELRNYHSNRKKGYLSIPWPLWHQIYNFSR